MFVRLLAPRASDTLNGGKQKRPGLRPGLDKRSEEEGQPFTAAATSAAKSLVCFSMPSPSA
jgi:hypothetical protein